MAEVEKDSAWDQGKAATKSNVIRHGGMVWMGHIQQHTEMPNAVVQQTFR